MLPSPGVVASASAVRTGWTALAATSVEAMVVGTSATGPPTTSSPKAVLQCAAVCIVLLVTKWTSPDVTYVSVTTPPCHPVDQISVLVHDGLQGSLSI